MDNNQTMLSLMNHAIGKRQPAEDFPEAYRLFNGFYEGFPGLVLDRYDSTLVILDHGIAGQTLPAIRQFAISLLGTMHGLNAVLLKQRQHPDQGMKNGVLIAGESLAKSVDEFGVKYALNLQMNQDAGFYLDTRHLRAWLKNHLSGLSVLNTFAYTGSLGVAAGAGGAAYVVQTDLNQTFLDLSQKSWALNHLPSGDCQIIAGDFFKVTSRMRHQSLLFDCVILDPPFFSTTAAGTVNLVEETTRLINKVRPLIAHEGYLVVINNALFLSGEDFVKELSTLCHSDYLSFEQMIPVPEDVTGFPDTVVDLPPADPAPFNHPTKIAILRAYRKDARKSRGGDILDD